MELLRSYAQMKAIQYKDLGELLTNSRIVDLFERQIDKYTSDLARFEKVKKFALLEEELTTESGELTPTLKPRRSVIEKKYATVIDHFYAEQAPNVAAV